MERVAPRPTMLDDRMRISRVPPEKLTARLTDVEDLLELSSMGIPDVNAESWSLEITGLVERLVRLSFDELRRLPKRTVESVFACSGDPRRPTVPLRRVANVKWAGVDLAELVGRAGIRREATHLWSYGLDHGKFLGSYPQPHYVKDMPLSHLREGDVLVAYELNDALLTPRNGFPARLVIPGFYGTNCVKWLCRLEFREHRASDFMTTRLYSDPDFDSDPSGAATRPVWAVAPESIIVAPKSDALIGCAPTEICGWAWSSCAVRSVEVSVDGGRCWAEAELEPANGRSWQRFSYRWRPAGAGAYELRCRATDVNGRTQPPAGARNAIHSIRVTV
jgi:DMSO/TMAO reductase YedYZ molybdopterin-dependent catalytic subunit